MDQMIMKRVIAGGLWLTMVKPGWHDLIDWYQFDVTRSDLCVAGQVFADEARAHGEIYKAREPWVRGYDMLSMLYGLDVAQRTRLGFTCDADDNPWGDLEDAWRTLWGPDPVPSRHVDYPHAPGALYDCPACEASGELDAS